MRLARTDIAVQFGWYLLVGATCFAVDIGSFVGLRGAGWPVIAASPASFLLGTTANYFLSYLLAFRRADRARGAELSRLLVVALVGLALNSLFVWIFVALGLAAVLAKVLAVPLVLAWNFLGRRALVFTDQLPDGTWEISNRLAERIGPVHVVDRDADPEE